MRVTTLGGCDYAVTAPAAEGSSGAGKACGSWVHAPAPHNSASSKVNIVADFGVAVAEAVVVTGLVPLAVGGWAAVGSTTHAPIADDGCCHRKCSQPQSRTMPSHPTTLL